MSKSWREIGVDARRRGRFLASDLSRWRDLATCPAAEAAVRYGLGRASSLIPREECYNPVLHGIGNVIGDAIIFNRFDQFDDLLDKIDDRALQLKREATDG